MKRLLSKGVKIMMILLCVLSLSYNIAVASVQKNGTDIKMTKHPIMAYNDGTDAADFTYVYAGRKRNAGKVLHITVTHMYDSHGNNKDDDWTYTRWLIEKFVNGSLVHLATDVKIKRGVYTDVTLSEKVTEADKLRVSARGNSKTYAAQISGYIHQFKWLLDD